jgi:hypothetical protein
MAPPVMSNDAIAVLAEEEHLCIPCIGSKWPAVREYNGPARTPVLEIYSRSVSGSNRVHSAFSLTVAKRSCSARRVGLTCKWPHRRSESGYHSRAANNNLAARRMEQSVFSLVPQI